MRTFVLLCAALAVLQTVTAMTGPEGHTTDESGGPPAGWPDNKEDCENMEGGFWREDHQRCESEDMCNTMGGFWDANRCELEEEGESDGPDNKEDCENMEGGFWQEDRQRCETELLCNEHGGQWTGFRCEFGEGHHSTTAYPGHHSNTAYPGHHSTTSEPYYTPSVKCAKSGGIWRDDPMMMPQLGWCDYSGTSHATTAAPHHHSTTISYWEQRERECTMHGGKWHWDIHWCDYHSTTAYPGHHWTTPYPGHTGHHTTTAHPGHHSTTAYPHTTTEHYGNDCIGDQCCGDGTQFENGVCVPTYEGVMDACREERKEWGWTCETSCPADGANGDI